MLFRNRLLPPKSCAPAPAASFGLTLAVSLLRRTDSVGKPRGQEAQHVRVGVGHHSVVDLPRGD
jgi:hypothetical protein